MILGKPGSGGGASGFNLNYDAVTPLRSVDVGGPDQEQRYAPTHSISAYIFFPYKKGWRISSQSPSKIQATI